VPHHVLVLIRLCLRRIINYPNNSNIIVVDVTENPTASPSNFQARGKRRSPQGRGGGRLTTSQAMPTPNHSLS